MNHPDDLRIEGSVDIELPSGRWISVPKATPALPIWRGSKPKDTFNGKAVLDFRGSPVFAEEYTLRTLQDFGWSAVWVNSYRREYLASYKPKVHAKLPVERQDLLSEIAGTTAFPTGCWDVFAWRDDRVLFAECKRAKKDAIRLSQRRWIESALDIGISIGDFLIVEWTIHE